MSESGLPADWRTRLERLGQRNFEIREMLRLGFLSAADPLRPGETNAALLAKIAELEQLQAELDEVDDVVASASRIETLLEEIRRERLASSALRKAERRRAREEQARQKQLAWATQRCERPPYLGAGVSTRLQYTGGDDDALASAGLPEVHTVLELADDMDTTTSEVQWLSYHRSVTTIDHYNRFTTPKRSGGTRTISSPKPRMRQAQTYIKTHILDQLSPASPATGFRTGLSIVSNAEPHVGAAVVIRMDIKDFFPTITFPRVRGYYESLGYNPGIATVLALLCTDSPRTAFRFEGDRYYAASGPRALPQGACTSPSLANLVARGLDERLIAWAAGRPESWTYTRYADDMVFSSNDANSDVASLIATVHTIVQDEGFSVNERKTAVMRAPHRQMVTGLVVNDVVRISRRQMRRLRAFLHQCEVRGLNAMTESLGTDARCAATGHLAYVNMVNHDQALKLLQRHPWIQREPLSPPGVRSRSRPGRTPSSTQSAVTPVTAGVTRLELADPPDGGKFWEVWVDGATLYRRYGPLGAPGTTSEKAFSTPEAAQSAAEQLIQNKLSGGYRPA
ncbi:MAG: WGR domain-containing protein [Actinobacteria bacterium]|nr:WGR domain-containing protein [Actinomycetota bacterium]